MMAATTAEKATLENGRPYDPPQRSKANPKHTLFGAEVQQLSEAERNDMKTLDLDKIKENQRKERQAYQQRYKAKLPPHLKKKLTGPVANVEESKREIQKKLDTNSKANKKCDIMEEQKKYFQDGAVENFKKELPTSEKKLTTLSDEKGFKNAQEINNIGVKAGTSSFNRDKYEAAKPNHQYTQIGSSIKLGMDFDDNSPSLTQASAEQYDYKRYPAPDWQHADAFMTKPKAYNQLTIDVPANIRHQFGTQVCRDLLGDKEQVSFTLEQQARDRATGLRDRKYPTHSIVNPTTAISEYEKMSHILRQNIFPGFPIDTRSSVMRHDYSPEVFQRRGHVTDEYRYRYDDLSKWVEQCVIHSRIKRDWDAKQASLQEK